MPSSAESAVLYSDALSSDSCDSAVYDKEGRDLDERGTFVSRPLASLEFVFVPIRKDALNKLVLFVLYVVTSEVYPSLELLEDDADDSLPVLSSRSLLSLSDNISRYSAVSSSVMGVEVVLRFEDRSCSLNELFRRRTVISRLRARNLHNTCLVESIYEHEGERPLLGVLHAFVS